MAPRIQVGGARGPVDAARHAKNGRKHDRLKARFDTLTEEHSDLLIENMELGHEKGAAARRKAIMLRIDEINAEAMPAQYICNIRQTAPNPAVDIHLHILPAPRQPRRPSLYIGTIPGNGRL